MPMCRNKYIHTFPLVTITSCANSTRKHGSYFRTCCSKTVCNLPPFANVVNVDFGSGTFLNGMHACTVIHGGNGAFE